MTEDLIPLEHPPPDTWTRMIVFRLRLLLDFQVRTVHRDVRAFFRGHRGRALDVGSGQSPYEHLADKSVTTYYGLDTVERPRFGGVRSQTLVFDGRRIPLITGSIDGFLCTDVIEHVLDPTLLLDEVHRVLKPGARGLVTIPWSARYHYAPHDYHRFTPSRLERLFARFSKVQVAPRGTDLTVIAAKIVVAWLRSLSRPSPWILVGLVATVTVVPAAVMLGHVSLLFGLGSSDDPLGYTIWVEK